MNSFSHYLRLGIVPAYLFLCLVLGGASAAGFWANMVLQLLAVPIIVWSLFVERRTPMSRAARSLMFIMLLGLLVIAIHLIPMPPTLWQALPGRADIAEGYRLLGVPLPWLPLSLAPRNTLASALWLLPSIAVFLGIIRLGNFKANWLAWVIAVVTGLAVVLGALQVTSGAGGDSGWYIYEITNVGVSTGFFSNANHFATLLVCTIPFLAALYLSSRGKSRSTQSSSAMVVILSGALAVVLVGIVLNTSLAGIGLSIPVAAASLFMIRSRRRRVPWWSGAVVGILAVASVALVFTTPFQNNLLGQDAAASPFSRYTSFSKSVEAAADYAPAGSGIGTFAQLYPRYEDPESITRVFMNHVHSDYIEIALETGILGIAVVLIFLAWWARRTVAIWRAENVDYFAAAATIATAAVLAHSIVDYPLRTAAIGALFAACCALMAEPRARVRRGEHGTEQKARHLSAD